MLILNRKPLIVLALLLIPFCINAQEGSVVIDQDKDIDKLLEFKKDVKVNNLYKIQVYQGRRSAAESTKASFMQRYGSWPVSMHYETPNYKIWVGNFKSRLEADKALLLIKKDYADAFIFKPKQK